MGSKVVFVDTNGWIALLNTSDKLSTRASGSWRVLLDEGYDFVTTNWIVAETGNGLARSGARDKFVDAVGALRSSPRARVVAVSDDLLDRALDLYASRTDKTWGLVDCASFVVMKDEGIREAFTNDKHFEQAGLSCLLPRI